MRRCSNSLVRWSALVVRCPNHLLLGYFIYHWLYLPLALYTADWPPHVTPHLTRGSLLIRVMIRTQRTLKFTPYCQVWVCLTEWGGEGRIRRCDSCGYRLPTDSWLLHSVFITLKGDAHIIPPLHQWVFSLPKNSEYHCVLLMLISVASVDQLVFLSQLWLFLKILSGHSRMTWFYRFAPTHGFGMVVFFSLQCIYTRLWYSGILKSSMHQYTVMVRRYS